MNKDIESVVCYTQDSAQPEPRTLEGTQAPTASHQDTSNTNVRPSVMPTQLLASASPELQRRMKMHFCQHYLQELYPIMVKLCILQQGSPKRYDEAFGQTWPDRRFGGHDTRQYCGREPCNALRIWDRAALECLHRHSKVIPHPLSTRIPQSSPIHQVPEIDVLRLPRPLISGIHSEAKDSELVIVSLFWPFESLDGAGPVDMSLPFDFTLPNHNCSTYRPSRGTVLVS
jgi:hypothetical protein